MEAWTAIDVPSLLIGRVDVLDQLLILRLPVTWLPFAPSIIAALANTKDSTHRFHGIRLLMFSYKLIALLYGFENTIKAFLGKSHHHAIPGVKDAPSS
jgi:hypothetical protein